MESYFIVYLLFVILVVSKIYLRFFLNKDMHRHRKLSSSLCPFCKNKIEYSNVRCSNCNKIIDANQFHVACYNCGYIGKMKPYYTTTEFWVTFLLCAFLNVASIIYLLAYGRIKICNNCGRIKRRSDYPRKLKLSS